MKQEDIDRAIAAGNKVLAQLKRLCPNPGEPGYPQSKKKKRIRQSRDHPNKLEQEWLDKLRADYPMETFRFGARRYRLANGAWYKPDITCTEHKWPESFGHRYLETAWEVKGPKSWRGGFEFLKVAASVWPDVRWVLVWKEDGQWNEQEVLP